MSSSITIAEVTIGPYQGEDESALLSLWNQTLLLDPIDDQVWRKRFLLDPHFDPSSCLLARHGDRVVGFLFGIRPPKSSEAWVVAFGVNRAYRRLGIATRLLDAVTDYWKEAGANRITIGPYVPTYITPGVDGLHYGEAIDWLIARGYQVKSRPIAMLAVLNKPFPESGETAFPSEDIEVREAEPSDILPLLAHLRVEFPHWISEVLPVMEDQFTGSGGATTLFVALEAGVIVGFSQSRSERFGPFGVAESHRGKGIGSRLLNATLPAMVAKGFRAAWFLWTDESAARLYRRHGFETMRTFAIMSHDLTEPTSDSLTDR